jgi:putative Mg2+ transporter-C (MgtC) family protein
MDPKRASPVVAVMERLLGANEFDILPHAIALAIAYLLAFPIGWNREKHERSAGLRTFPLVAIASCAFVQASEAFTIGHPDAQSRVIEGLLAGMGFIGGGAILKHGAAVHGTATAASLWATGAIGVSVGLGAIDVAVMIALVTFLTLWLAPPLKEIAQEEGNGKPENPDP